LLSGRRLAIDGNRFRRDGRVDVERLGLNGKLEAARHDADDGVRLPVQNQHAADGVRRALKLPHPELVPEHDRVADWSPTRRFLFGAKCAPDLWLDAEHIEEVRRDPVPAEALRLRRTGECVRALVVDREMRKAAVVRAEVGEIRHADRVEAGRARIAHIERTEGDELFRLRKRERLQQDGIDDTEDRGVRANPDRQCEHRDDREARRFLQLPKREAKFGHGRALWENRAIVGSTRGRRARGRPDRDAADARL
jgi:hypothetical protein